jgi:hypothetical protein
MELEDVLAELGEEHAEWVPSFVADVVRAALFATGRTDLINEAEEKLLVTVCDIVARASFRRGAKRALELSARS